MGQGVKRADLDNKEIALAWIAGASHLELSVTYDCSPTTIANRLKRARVDHPELPWDDHQVVVGGAGKASSTKEYLAMNDGKPGDSALPRGSIVNGGSLRGR